MKHIGIYAHMRSRGGAEKRSVVMAEHLSCHHRVSLLVSDPFDVPALERFYDVDLSRVHIVVVGAISRLSPAAKFSLTDLRYKAAALRERLTEYRTLRALDLDLFINNAVYSKMVCPAKRGIFMCMFPHNPDSLRSSRPSLGKALDYTAQLAARRLSGRSPEAFQTYDVITANSDYTSRWIQRWWGRSAQVVYSVCDPIGLTHPKEKIILSVGRFTVDDPDLNYKAQDILLSVFKRLTALHRAGWQLHLAGSLASYDAAGAELVRKWQREAADLPVFFHVNAPLPELRTLYGRAAIYWHATGYGYPEAQFPVKQEHFGITTVEALSAGAVPIVLNSGGHRETVQQGVTGFRWDTLDGLADYTLQVAGDPDLREQLSRNAAASCAPYTRDAFKARIENIVSRLL